VQDDDQFGAKDCHVSASVCRHCDELEEMKSFERYNTMQHLPHPLAFPLFHLCKQLIF
jgi:hypothetical protein